MRGIPLTEREFDKVKTLLDVELKRSEIADLTNFSQQLVGAIANADSFDDYKSKQKENRKNREVKKIFEGAELIEDDLEKERDYDAEARYNMSKEGREENTLYHINNRLLAIDAKLDILMESSKRKWF